MRTKRVQENIIEDITSRVEKPSWVYLTEEQIKKFFNRLSLNYRVYCWLLLDSCMRVTEANSIQVKNFNEDFTQVTIPEGASKTFERTINLKLSTSLIKDFVREHDLKANDYIFLNQPFTINKYLRYHAKKYFGDNISHPKSKGNYKTFTMYDIRHNAACYWFNRYPTHKGLMYRFGWRKADKIEYYSQFLGVADEIKDSDMIIGEDKTKLAKLELQSQEQQKLIDKLLGQNKRTSGGLVKALNEISQLKQSIKK